jgi:hypothetical protein
VGFQVRHLLTKVRGRFTELSGTVRIDEQRSKNSSVALTIDDRGEHDGGTSGQGSYGCRRCVWTSVWSPRHGVSEDVAAMAFLFSDDGA